MTNEPRPWRPPQSPASDKEVIDEVIRIISDNYLCDGVDEELKKSIVQLLCAQDASLIKSAQKKVRRYITIDAVKKAHYRAIQKSKNLILE